MRSRKHTKNLRKKRLRTKKKYNKTQNTNENRFKPDWDMVVIQVWLDPEISFFNLFS